MLYIYSNIYSRIEGEHMAQKKTENELKSDEISNEKRVEILLKKYENSAVVVDIMEAVELGKKIGANQK